MREYRRPQTKDDSCEPGAAAGGAQSLTDPDQTEHRQGGRQPRSSDGAEPGEPVDPLQRVGIEAQEAHDGASDQEKRHAEKWLPRRFIAVSMSMIRRFIDGIFVESVDHEGMAFHDRARQIETRILIVSACTEKIGIRKE